MDKTFGIHLGALCDPIAEQLKKQGFEYDPKKAEEFQKYATAILTLRFADLLPDSVYDKINQKLFKQIQAHVIKKNKLKKAAKPIINDNRASNY
jgi:hypothetical protein